LKITTALSLRRIIPGKIKIPRPGYALDAARTIQAFQGKPTNRNSDSLTGLSTAASVVVGWTMNVRRRG
jgi:hypothetical protein